MLAHSYKFDERLITRFFSWSGGWSTSQPSMASLYSRTGIEDLEERMIMNKGRVIEEMEEAKRT
jgi:hypothetical protein